jgi:hypothetical protein
MLSSGTGLNPFVHFVLFEFPEFTYLMGGHSLLVGELVYSILEALRI